MRGPDYQMMVIKSMGNTEGARRIADPRHAVVMDLPPKRIAGQRGKVCVIVLKRQSRNDDAEVVVAVNLWKQMSNFLVDFANLLIVELLLNEGRVWYDGNLPLLIVDAQFLESGLTGEVGMFCLIRDKICIQILLGLLLIDSILSKGLRTGEKQQSKNEITFI